MEHFSKYFAFLHWIMMYLLEFFQIVTRTPTPESTDIEDVAVYDEISESTTVETQKVDVSQQTDDPFETQKQKAREDELMKEISELQDQLETAHRVNGESRRKADKLAWEFGMFQSRHQEEIAELTRKRSDEIIHKEIEIMEFQDEYNNRIADLELTNANLMQRIIELELEQASRPQQHVCEKRSGELKDSVTKIEGIQQHLSSLDVITEHAKWTINHVLEQVKGGIASASGNTPQLDDEKERLIKDANSMKSEMESVKLELDDAKRIIAELEQRQSGLIAAESQMKTIADDKDALLASKDAELKQLRESCEQARRKSEVKTRDVECGTDDLPPSAKVPKADPEFKEVVSKKTKAKRKAKEAAAKKEERVAEKDKAPGKSESIYESVMEALSPSQVPPTEAKRYAEVAAAKKEERVAEKDNTPEKSESIYKTVMDVLASPQSPPPSGKTASPPSGERPAPPSGQKPAPPSGKTASPPSGERPAPPSGQKPAPPSGQRPAPQPATDVKPAVFPSADIRYKDKPIEGYTANLSEGKTPVHPPARPKENATATAAPSVAPVKAKYPTVATKPAPSFAIISKEVKQFESADKLVLLGIHQKHYGRVVGRGGENVRRVQEAHGVIVSFVQDKNILELYNLNITRGSPEKRRAAAREIIECVPVTIECSNVDLRLLRHPKFRDGEGGFFVLIRRPMSRDEKLQFTGRLDDCRKAFDVLVNGVLPPRPSPPK